MRHQALDWAGLSWGMGHGLLTSALWDAVQELHPTFPAFLWVAQPVFPRSPQPVPSALTSLVSLPFCHGTRPLCPAPALELVPPPRLPHPTAAGVGPAPPIGSGMGHFQIPAPCLWCHVPPGVCTCHLCHIAVTHVAPFLSWSERIETMSCCLCGTPNRGITCWTDPSSYQVEILPGSNNHLVYFLGE